MSDDADLTDAREGILVAANVEVIRKAAAEISEGTPGECYDCGEHSERLVEGVCARCRDIAADRKRRYGI